MGEGVAAKGIMMIGTMSCAVELAQHARCVGFVSLRQRTV